MKYATLPWACYISKAYAEEAQRRFLSPNQRYSSLNTELSIAYSKYNLNLFSELSNYIHNFMNSFIGSFMGSFIGSFMGSSVEYLWDTLAVKWVKSLLFR
nr:MAG TPA: hypothetical protein [Caudoviricetes sp.]